MSCTACRLPALHGACGVVGGGGRLVSEATPGFAPVAVGMALPHVDAVVEGHSLAALEHLAEVVLGRSRAVAEVAGA